MKLPGRNAASCSVFCFVCQEFILLLNQTPGINTVSQRGICKGQAKVLCMFCSSSMSH